MKKECEQKESGRKTKFEMRFIPIKMEVNFMEIKIPSGKSNKEFSLEMEINQKEL